MFYLGMDIAKTNHVASLINEKTSKKGSSYLRHAIHVATLVAIFTN